MRELTTDEGPGWQPGAGTAGVSAVALLASVAFWTWLWGPLGLVLGTLLSDTPALAPEYGYYQRLLARDQSEAADLIERYIKTESPRSVYDALLLPALNYAERDRLGAALVARRGKRRHRRDAGAAVGRRGVDPGPQS
jgi:hypothetical protein